VAATSKDDESEGQVEYDAFVCLSMGNELFRVGDCMGYVAGERFECRKGE
jgi:hypothetical protein